MPCPLVVSWNDAGRVDVEDVVDVVDAVDVAVGRYDGGGREGEGEGGEGDESDVVGDGE